MAIRSTQPGSVGSHPAVAQGACTVDARMLVPAGGTLAFHALGEGVDDLGLIPSGDRAQRPRTCGIPRPGWWSPGGSTS